MRKYSISSAVLKNAACLSMFIDHFFAIVIIAYMDGVVMGSGALHMTQDFYHIGRAVGRTAFILYAFMAAEGFRHTRSRGRYLLRLLIFAVISEVPFDLAFQGSFFDMEKQNVYWTLFMGVVALCLLDKLRRNPALQTGCVLLLCMAAALLSTDYAAMGVLLIIVFYLCRDSFPLQFAAGSVVIYFGMVLNYILSYWGSGYPITVYLQASVSELYGLFAFCFIYCYNGKKGRQLSKTFYYWFYPLHLLLLYGIAAYLFPRGLPG